VRVRIPPVAEVGGGGGVETKTSFREKQQVLVK